MHHQGMGDMINISGAAVYLADNYYDRFNFPCHAYAEISMRSMFASHPKIRVFVLTYQDEMGLFPIIPEEMKGDILSTHWVLSGKFPDSSLSRFENEYASLGVPYSERWDSCPILEACKQVEQIPVPDEPYAFVHDDQSRDMVINSKYLTKGMRVIRPDPNTPDIFSYCSLITHAAEGHYADSCFRHLAECLKPAGTLYFHEYAKYWSPIRGEPEPPSRLNWVTFR